MILLIAIGPHHGITGTDFYFGISKGESGDVNGNGYGFGLGERGRLGFGLWLGRRLGFGLGLWLGFRLRCGFSGGALVIIPGRLLFRSSFIKSIAIQLNGAFVLFCFGCSRGWFR